MESALFEQNPDQLKKLSRHAETCISCRTQLQSWHEISAAARTLHQSWDSPHLWPGIRQELERISALQANANPSWYRVSFVPWLRVFGWRTALAGLALLTISLVSTWILLSRYPVPSASADWLLTEQALQEIEESEQAYIQSIEKLWKLTSSRMQTPESSLIASYREKLRLIDAAIADCRAYVADNRLNAHLRRELLSIYQEKQRTLQQVLKEKDDAKN
jgi:hypothetical protein